MERTVLVVDDDPMLREWISFLLHSQGYRAIAEAANGEEALALCERVHPDLVLLDINMPRMDGLLALQNIRQISPESQVLMVSVEATPAHYEEAIRHGAAGFVVKPFQAERLLKKIDSCFSEEAGL